MGDPGSTETGSLTLTHAEQRMLDRLRRAQQSRWSRRRSAADTRTMKRLVGKGLARERTGTDGRRAWEPAADEKPANFATKPNRHDRANNVARAPTMQTIILTLTVDQAEVVRKAVDLYTRLSLGQLECIADLVREDILPPMASQGDARRSADLATVDAVVASLFAAKRSLQYVPHGSMGITHPHVHASGQRAYRVEKALRRALTHARAGHDALGPTPLFFHTDDPEPTARVQSETPP